MKMEPTIRVKFRCNLDDVMRQEIWPKLMVAVPQVGDVIQSARKFKGDRVVQLRVCRVTWVPDTTMDMQEAYHEWIPVIELGLMPYWTVTRWEDWYNSLVM